MTKTRFLKIQKWVLIVLALLLLLLLLLLGIRDNTKVYNVRDNETITVMQEVPCRLVEEESSPAGLVTEYEFTLQEELVHDSHLMFYVSHQLVDVWVGEDHVYSLRPSGQLTFIKTSGSKWIRIPLYREDAGQIIRVVLTPVYDDLLKDDTEFMLGSPLALYKELLHRMFPALALSIVNVLGGILILLLSIYFLWVKRGGTETLALGMLAVSIGLWQLMHNDFSPFIAEGKEIFLYYMSVTMMLICTIPLIYSAIMHNARKEYKTLRCYTVLVAVMAMIQVLLQLLGVCDLREMFLLTHGSIILGAVLLIGHMIKERTDRKGENQGKLQNAWILVIGILADMIFYYVLDSSSGLVMTLAAVLGFVLLEGGRLVRGYVKQSVLLEEKENQLTQSRILTMMSQIRSHFVFNILNAISGMCKYDPEKADETVVRFARYLRNNIDIMEDDKMLPFTTELQRLEDYVILEQVRFGDRIEFVTDLGITDFMIPPLLLQPIVENAIKHGITKKVDGGTIRLSTWQENDMIYISVVDNGVGFDEQELEKEKSVGLKNIRFRLKHLMQGTLTIQSEPGKGSSAVISFPRKGAEI